MKKENINTDDFWDQQFREEYEFISGHRPSGYWRWFPGRFEAIAKEIQGPIAKVLDVGCGLGHLVRYLEARMPLCDIQGCDFSNFAVLTTVQLGSHAFQSDCYSFSQDAPDIDYVIGSEIIEHIDHSDKFLRECKKSLRKGGKCIITTPVEGRYEKAPDHIKEFSIGELRELMEKYFTDVVIKDYQEFQLAIGYKN